MTSGLETYLEALSETKKLIDPPEGLSKYNASSKADEVIIKLWVLYSHLAFNKFDRLK